METSVPPTPVPVRRAGRLTKAQKIGWGLLLTVAGIILLSLLIPTAPGKLGFALPVAGLGIMVLWVGGILMGIGSRS